MIKTLREHVVYENKYVTVRDDDVAFPDGSKGTYYFSRWKAPYGVAISCTIDGKILLVRNYRYSERAYSLEIPQGFGNQQSTPEEDARRELKEETGIIAGNLVRIGVVGRDYETHLYHCSLDEEPDICFGGREHSEDIDGYVLFPFAGLDLLELSSVGIFDGVTIIAMLHGANVSLR